MDRQTTGPMLQKIRRDAEELSTFVAALCDDVAKWRQLYDEAVEAKRGK